MAEGGIRPNNSKRYEKYLKWKHVTKQSDLLFQASGLPRPQETSKDLMQRMRQLNFGELELPKENPRKQIIMNWTPHDRMLQSLEKWQCYYTDAEHGEPKPTWIQTELEFQDMMKKLCECEEITVDLEAHNNSTITGYVALIQIGTWLDGDYLIDAIKLRNLISSDLKYILESEEILKIVHGCSNDVLWLQRDFSIYLTAAIDTQFMFQLQYGVTDIAYKKLVTQLRPDLSDLLAADETLSDWRLRPGYGMTREQEIYAVNDVHVLLRIFDQLRFEIQAVNDDPEQLKLAFEMTKKRLLPVYKNPNKSTVDYNKLANMEIEKLKQIKEAGTRTMASNIKEEDKKMFEHFMEWRSVFAKILDEKEDSVIKACTLLKIACVGPNSLEQISSITGTLPPRIDKQKIIILKILQGGDEYMDFLRSTECHNCLKTGHGPAWGCPFPKNHANYKIWMNRPENAGWKAKQSERRVQNAKQKGYDPKWK